MQEQEGLSANLVNIEAQGHFPDVTTYPPGTDFTKSIETAARLGFKSFRFDVRWEKAILKPGEVDREYLERVAIMASEIKKQGG